jgi:hypothetical protein
MSHGVIMAGLVPAIHVFAAGKARMPATMGQRSGAVLFERLWPGMTADMPDWF